MKIYRVRFYYQYEGYIEFLCEDFYTKKKGAKEQHDKNVKQLNNASISGRFKFGYATFGIAYVDSLSRITHVFDTTYDKVELQKEV